MENQVFQTEIINKSLKKFFLSRNLPFTAVENPYFLDFVDELRRYDSEYRPPCRLTLAHTVTEKVHTDEAAKDLLLNNTDSVLMIDSLKHTCCNRKYQVFSLRTIRHPQINLWSKDISLEQETAANVGFNICRAINFASEEFNSHVFAVISVDDVKMTSGIQNASERLGRNLIQLTCSSQSGNRLVEKFVEVNGGPDGLVNTINEVIRTFRGPKLNDLLRVNFGGTKIKNFPGTRFCYLRDSCNIILNNLDYMQKICERIDDVQIRETITDILFDQEFIDQLNHLVTHLDPICKLINTCQSSESNVADSTEMWLNLRLPTDAYNDWIVQQRNLAIWPVGFAANLLHHTYQGLAMTDEQKDIAHRFMQQNFDENVLREYNYYINHVQEFKNFANRSETPNVYWKILSFRFEHLGKCALKLMILPASTALLYNQ